MNKNKTTILASAVVVSAVLMSGCGLFSNEGPKKIDPPKNVTMTKDDSTSAAAKKTAGKINSTQEAVKTELYLIDRDGYVVPKTIALPKTTSVAKQALDYLVTDGPVSNLLPNGFRPVLPAGTETSVDVNDGIAKVNFSNEFKNYKASDEMKILESITWTLTQFNTIKNVQISMNGKELTKMPVAGTPISENLSRTIGINMDNSNALDITNTRPVTVYYIGGEEGSYYYVPVTKRVNNKENDNVVAAVDELIKGPNENSDLVSDFMPDVKLLGTPKVENGKVTLNFNDSIYGSFEKKIISQHLLDSLVLSLTEQPGIQQVSVLVDGKADLVKENGKKLTAPVMRPEKVNTGSF